MPSTVTPVSLYPIAGVPLFEPGDDVAAIIAEALRANGEDFLAPFRRATKGELCQIVLVVEGSIPNENIKYEGFSAAMG